MKNVLLTIFATLILSSCASSTPKTKQSSVDFDNAVTQDGEKLICVSEKMTGTRIKTKTCMTRAEKEAARKDSEEFVNRLKRTPELRGSEPPRQ
ncbi:MAG: hypothetical protein L3J24_07510 [Xanthomonadales bacterium]|nr:hypothetical protein [Xanthomonadales bacterium]